MIAALHSFLLISMDFVHYKSIVSAMIEVVLHDILSLQMWRCTYPGCGILLKSKSTYREHMNRHCGKYLYYCPYCEKGLSRSNDVLRHMKNKHTGVYTYHCNKCHQDFSKLTDLTYHMKNTVCHMPQ